MISKFFTRPVEIARSVWLVDEGIEYSEYQTVETTRGHLQQASPEQVMNLANRMTLTHIVWLPCTTDVEVGDTITISDHTYSVRSIKNNCLVGSQNNKHLQVLVEQHESTSGHSGS